MGAHSVRFDQAPVGGFSNRVEQELRERQKFRFGDGRVGPRPTRVRVVGDVRYGLIVESGHPVYSGTNRVTHRAGAGQRNGDDVRIVVSRIG